MYSPTGWVSCIFCDGNTSWWDEISCCDLSMTVKVWWWSKETFHLTTYFSVEAKPIFRGTCPRKSPRERRRRGYYRNENYYPFERSKHIREEVLQEIQKGMNRTEEEEINPSSPRNHSNYQKIKETSSLFQESTNPQYLSTCTTFSVFWQHLKFLYF